MQTTQRRKPRLVTIELEAMPPWPMQERYIVRTAAGEMVGFITKDANTKTETHPWKAYRPRFVAGSRPQFGDYVGAFFNGRYNAVHKLVEVNYGEPRPITIAEG